MIAVETAVGGLKFKMVVLISDSMTCCHPTTIHDAQKIVKRITKNDFSACKSEKSPIGSKVKSRSKAPWPNQRSLGKTLGETVVNYDECIWPPV